MKCCIITNYNRYCYKKVTAQFSYKNRKVDVKTGIACSDQLVCFSKIKNCFQYCIGVVLPKTKKLVPPLLRFNLT